MASGARIFVGTRVARLRGVGRRARKLPFIPLTVLTTMLVCAIFAPLLAPHDPRGRDETMRERSVKKLTPPFQSWENPLGTDVVGRDVLSRLIFGPGPLPSSA